jgi:hypothetical protein
MQKQQLISAKSIIAKRLWLAMPAYYRSVSEF